MTTNHSIEELTVKEKDELRKKLKEGEEDIKNGKVYKARDVFKELGEEYGLL